MVAIWYIEKTVHPGRDRFSRTIDSRAMSGVQFGTQEQRDWVSAIEGDLKDERLLTEWFPKGPSHERRQLQACGSLERELDAFLWVERPCRL